MKPYNPIAPSRNRVIFSRRVVFSCFQNILMIQNTMAANTQRNITPVSGAIHKGRRYLRAFAFKPLKVLDTIILRLASVFLFFILLAF